jgi:uncharacterized membrane protein
MFSKGLNSSEKRISLNNTSYSMHACTASLLRNVRMRKILIFTITIDDSPYYVFVVLCIVIILVSLIKIAASNEKILNVFANILLLAIVHLTLAFLKVLARVRTKNKPS